MVSHFHTVGVVSKYTLPHLAKPLKRLCSFLLAQHRSIFLEQEAAALLTEPTYAPYFVSEIAEKSDLLIALGGDGTLIRAARAAAAYNTPVLGIHFGRLGFLTDLPQSHFEESLLPILDGEYREEKRLLLEASLYRAEKKFAYSTALNDVVLYKGSNTRAIEFDMTLSAGLSTHQHADGMIVSTPTGSTAYALSGGGPLLSPTLDVFLLMAMFPHTLTHRPLVLESTAQITLTLTSSLPYPAKVIYDGQLSFDLEVFDSIVIQKQVRPLHFIHPPQHNWFQTLKEKMGWQTNI